MPLTIKTLMVTVHVKSDRRESPMHEPARPERPSLEYAMPITDQMSHGDPDPNKMATIGKGAATGRGPISARNADAYKIADRVYELMKREIILGQHRGGLVKHARR